MAISPNSIGSLAADSQSLDKLRYQARQSPDQALKAVAQQFETVFLNMMLKTMREATPQDGMMDSEQTKMFTGMLDQQLAQEMSKRGVGLAEVMMRQLSGGLPAAPAAAPGVVSSAYQPDPQQDFVERLRPHAEQASRSTGVPANFIMGQAALESGWGKREIKHADGSNSYNLFGIKAGSSWNGKVAEVTTTEYQDGVASKQVARFRAYDNYTEAFQDYAKLLGGDSRYAGVLGQADAKGFAQALQQSGYATDPRYADKLVDVIGSVRARA
ncbi:MAG: flagellar assembly peptidoglycan hydrolase FlgJ [Gammaproteobacteria bacterium]|nr:flagellar assembly peptidoglycan hydrolase FlgJ [Sideroxydans sp.]MBU3904334.1 flagellar assembly peptidoglycan hydrolase FlgJ [Gammaproteobacteria bacterium]MBU4046133.1 flagellar assembly peptidoglycan hydrolase FlgJ [Gammaproteobacteria bacterium]MBU4150893.1 flagellar assembly peptidoglycan hydrolase FlgJ [Gammaproteobacteria bacterium]